MFQVNRDKKYKNIPIIYKLKDNKGKHRIFGKKFVENNKNKAKIEINGKKYELKEYLEDAFNNFENNDFIQLNLILYDCIVDMSYMFYKCNELLKFPKIKVTQQKKNIENQL